MADRPEPPRYPIVENVLEGGRFRLFSRILASCVLLSLLCLLLLMLLQSVSFSLLLLSHLSPVLKTLFRRSVHSLVEATSTGRRLARHGLRHREARRQWSSGMGAVCQDALCLYYGRGEIEIDRIGL